MLSLAWWWLAVELLGLIALPVCFVIFPRLHDRGYAWSKILGILLVSYLLWLGGETRILPNSRASIVIIALTLSLGSFLLFLRHRSQLRQHLAQNLRLVLTVEALFLGLFALWAWFRAYNPEIQFTEKPMDFAFLNAVVRSSYFPPQDPWLAGQPLNYYYFGYLMMGMLVKLTGVAPSTGFNLAIAMLLALTAIGVFGLVYNLVAISSRQQGGNRKGILFGLVAVFFLLFLANWEGVLELAYARGWGPSEFWSWIGIKDLTYPPPATGFPGTGYWWWRATRVIDTLSNGVSLDYTITEFPFFSFLLADLHAHVMSLPLVLLFLGMSLNYLSGAGSTLGRLKGNPLGAALLALSLGSLGFVHTWDLPTYGAVFAVIVFVRAHLSPGSIRRYLVAALFILALLAAAYVLYLPFYLQYRSPVSLILPWSGPSTRPVHYLLLWIPFLFICVSFLVSQAGRKLLAPTSLWKDVLWGWLVVMLPLGLWVGADLVIRAITAEVMGDVSVLEKLWHLLPVLVLLLFAWLVLVGHIRRARREHEGAESTLFVLLLIFVGLFLTYGSELFFLLDIHGSRVNTVFRLYYQAWLMLSVASAFAVYHFSQSHWRWARKVVWWGICLLLVAGAFVYVPAASWSKTNGFAGSPTLDGLAFLHGVQPAEWRAAEYLDKIEGTPVVVEAAGEDYTDYARIASYTGLPTILGWFEHEWQWRGNPAYLRGRQQDVDVIYRSQDTARVKALLWKYNVTYVYAGRLERQKYGEKNLQKFAGFMETVFSDEGVTIYKVKE